MNENNIMLKVEDLKKYFPVRRGFFQRVIGWVKAVDGVTLSIEKDEIYGIAGESGCGKTTLIKALTGLI